MKYVTRRVMDGDDDEEGPEQHVGIVTGLGTHAGCG